MGWALLPEGGIEVGGVSRITDSELEIIVFSSLSSEETEEEFGKAGVDGRDAGELIFSLNFFFRLPIKWKDVGPKATWPIASNKVRNAAVDFLRFAPRSRYD